MAKKRERLKIRDKIEIEVAEILNEFVYSHKEFNADSTIDLLIILQRHFNLQIDPFTHSYISSLVYAETIEEYYRQLEENRFG